MKKATNPKAVNPTDKYGVAKLDEFMEWRMVESHPTWGQASHAMRILQQHADKNNHKVHYALVIDTTVV